MTLPWHIALTLFGALILGLGIFVGIKFSNKVMMVFAILFGLALAISNWFLG